jgi:putative DNA primase/helicase
MTISDTTISSARSVAIDQVIVWRGIKLRGKIERVGPCPRCGGTDRFSINTRKGVFNCRGCNVGGDAMSLTRFLDGSSFRDACLTLAGERASIKYHGPQRRLEPRPVTESDEHRQRSKARYLFGSSVPAAGTLVKSYLQARGIGVPSSALRFLPPRKPTHHPAVLVPYGLPDEPEPGVIDIAIDAITAVQLTLLKPDGASKADVEPNKMTVGSPAGKPMVVAPINDLLGLAICEGAEDALSAHQATGLGAWASGGDSFLPKIADAVPDYVEAVTIYAHSEERAQRCVRELADALDARGIAVFIEGIRL